MPVLPVPEKNGGQDEQALGRSRGGFSTKIHVTVDGLGYPLRLELTAGQRHDIIKAYDLIVDLDFDFVLADRSYGAQDFLEAIAASGAEAVIPPKKNAKEPREYDEWRSKGRFLLIIHICKHQLCFMYEGRPVATVDCDSCFKGNHHLFPR